MMTDTELLQAMLGEFRLYAEYNSAQWQADFHINVHVGGLRVALEQWFVDAPKREAEYQAHLKKMAERELVERDARAVNVTALGDQQPAVMKMPVPK